MVEDSRRHGMPAVNRRTTIITIVAAVVLVAGTVALVGEAASWDSVLDAIRKADKRWLPLCLAGELVAYAGYVLAYRDLARVDGGPRLPLGVVVRVVMIGFGATVVGASAGGLAVDFWALNRAGASGDDAARRVLALNTLEWAVLAVAASVAGILVALGADEEVPIQMALAWPALTAVCVAAGWWISNGERGRRMARVPPRGPGLRRRAGSWWPWLRPLLRRALADAVGGLLLMRRVLAQPAAHATGLLGYPVYWAGNLLCLGAALRAFGAHPGVLALLLAYTTAYCASALPLPVGGAGGIEASMAFALHAVGVDLAPAILAVLVFRGFTFWLPIIPAVITLTGARRLDDDLVAIGQAAPAR